MLDPNDLKQIRQIMKDEIQDNNKALDKRFSSIDKKMDQRFEETGQEVFGLENRLTAKMDRMKKEIIVEVGDFITDRILPQIEEKADQKEVDRIKAHLGM